MVKRFEARVVLEERVNSTPRIVSFDTFEQPSNNNYLRFSDSDMLSLRALVMYTAAKWDIPESIIESELCRAFDYPDLKAFPALAYDEVVRWLVYWQMGFSV